MAISVIDTLPLTERFIIPGVDYSFCKYPLRCSESYHKYCATFLNNFKRQVPTGAMAES